LNYIINNLMF